MPVKDRKLYRERAAARARLRLRRRYTRFYPLLPLARTAATTTLIVSLVIGGIRWLTLPHTAGALEFTPHTISTGGFDTTGVQGLAAADIDGDGDQDFATAGRDGIKVYENTGNFNFTPHVVDDKHGERIQIIDLNNDDELDLFATFKGDSPSARWYRKVDGFTFTANTIATAGRDAVGYAGDINGDNANDIVTASFNGSNSTLERWMNDGSGTFAATTVDAASGVRALTIDDLDADGFQDIVIGGDQGLQRWDYNGSEFNRTDVDDDNANRTHLSVAGNNGTTYIGAVDASVNEVIAYHSSHTANTAVNYTRTELDTDTDGKTIVATDLEGDGDLDFVVAAQDDNSLLFFENKGSNSFSKSTISDSISSVYGVAVADFDGDGDLDVVTGDHTTGTITLFERTLAKPQATSPTDISQSTAATGKLNFTTIISDADSDPTKIRVQYSTDGSHWYKPWITNVTANNGNVDLKNSNGYQIGTSNKIDTDDNDTVELTITWDTKSSENTGGPISGDVDTVQLRVIPHDGRSNGEAAISSTFRVDNQSPANVAGLTITSISSEEATLSWSRPSDSSAFGFRLYYGTDRTAVLERTSDVWDAEDDPDMNDVELTSTTVTGLEDDKTYYFKLFVVDTFGNTSAAPSVSGVASGEPSGTPTPTPTTSVTPTPTVSPTVTPTPTTTPSPTSEPSPTPTSDTLTDNTAPIADAGPDQVVNPGALVILDGTASLDTDPGETGELTYNWRQLSGPTIDLLSSRTATASFSARAANDTYIFSLTVRDNAGASSTDSVTVAVQELPAAPQTPVDVVTTEPTDTTPTTTPISTPPIVTQVLQPANIVLLVLSLLSTLVLIIERLANRTRERTTSRAGALTTAERQPQGQVVHYKTGEPIAGAQVLIYTADGKLRANERTNNQGAFSTFFPAGAYTIDVRAPGFSFAPAASRAIAPPESLLYTGGKLNVKDANRPIAMVIPMKPTAEEVSSARIQLLHAWQTFQRFGRALSWPLFLAGALLNTTLVFLAPGLLHLGIEVLYIALVIVKIALEVRVRPAYGLVRDAITHIPLDLSVVRLFDQKTNRLIMTRVTNNQGKFFALPPSGTYRVTIAKPGYATFSKDNVQIKSQQDTTLQITADLMPVTPTPSGSLATAKAGTI